jgi:hypothetical protein
MKKNVWTVAGVIALVGATLLGRLLGWMFGLQFVLPIVIGLWAAGYFEHHKAKRFAAALGVQAAYLSYVALGIGIAVVHGNFYIGFFGVVLHLISVVGFIALIVQPGAPPAILLILRHGFSLIRVLQATPPIIKSTAYISRASIVETIIVGFFAVLEIVLLARALKPEK